MDRSKHEPTYLGVAKFTDEDMILIKNAISRVQKYPNEPHKQLVRGFATKAAQELKLNEVPKKKIDVSKNLVAGLYCFDEVKRTQKSKLLTLIINTLSILYKVIWNLIPFFSLKCSKNFVLSYFNLKPKS